MNKLLYATILTCVVSFSTDCLAAKASKEQESAVIKASYALPKKDGDEFRQTLREADEENVKARQQVILDHADMYDILSAPEFDRSAFSAKAREVRKLQDQEKENRDDAFAAAVAQLTPDERKTLAAALDVNPQHTARHHHMHADDNTTKGTTNPPSGAAPEAQ